MRRPNSMRHLDDAIRRLCGGAPQDFVRARTVMAHAIVASMQLEAGALLADWLRFHDDAFKGELLQLAIHRGRRNFAAAFDKRGTHSRGGHATARFGQTIDDSLPLCRVVLFAYTFRLPSI